MRKKFNVFIISSVLFMLGGSVLAQNLTPISPKSLEKHVYKLASPEMSGRFPGTTGDLSAATYIRQCLLGFGLTPLCEQGFQTFQVTTGIKQGPSNKLVVNGYNGVVDQDFMPVTISDNGKLTAPLVFLGYGMKISSDTLNWDDYAGVDVKGKIGLILIGAPEPPKGSAIDPFEAYISLRTKLLIARDAGVGAVILVAGVDYDAKDELEFGNVKESTAGLPVVRVKRSFINQALSAATMKIEEVERQFNQLHHPLSRALDLTATVETDVITQTANTRNIAFYIPARDTGQAQNWVVVGAHFDHLGLGGQGSGSRIQDTIGIHPGADDNASGVAAVLEIADRLSSIKKTLHRSVLFVAFSGEEMGLLGSKYFISHCPVPLNRISAMINLDMVGRPNEEKRLTISGTGTAIEMDSLLNLIPKGNLTWATTPEGFGPSDHASFYSSDIPVLYFSTGAHLDYHTPADTPDKLDYHNMAEIVNEVSQLVLEICNTNKNLTFRESGPKIAEPGRKKLKVTLGIMPDVSGTENNGLRVEFASPGKPAQLAGIRKGDRITAINGQPVTNVYDYMTRLQTLKPGQTVSVELLRGTEKLVVLVQL